jgi:hypothetical protein
MKSQRLLLVGYDLNIKNQQELTLTHLDHPADHGLTGRCRIGELQHIDPCSW